MDMGAYVIVVNADKVTVTGRKASQKTYFRHVTGRPGSYTVETFNELQKVGFGIHQLVPIQCSAEYGLH